MADYNLFGGDTGDVRPLLEPAICVICEAAPDQSVTRVLDTMRWFRPARFTDILGRKYICEDCVKDLGASFGLVAADVHAEATAQVEMLKTNLVSAEKRISAYQALENAVSTLTTIKEATK